MNYQSAGLTAAPNLRSDPVEEVKTLILDLEPLVFRMERLTALASFITSKAEDIPAKVACGYVDRLEDDIGELRKAYDLLEAVRLRL